MGLNFKGDAPKKKKRKTTSSEQGGQGRAQEEHVDGWLPIPSASLALGPIYITLPTTQLTPSLCMALQPTTGKVIPQPLVSSAKLAASTSALASLEQEDIEAIVEGDEGSEGPSDVHHVWVCARIPDTQDKITLRSATGKFLAADEVGVVTAEREARGMQEEWTVEDAAEGSGLILKSAYGKFLSVDVLAGGKIELRADEENESDTERWKIYMQGDYVLKAKKAFIERSGVKAAASAHESGGLTIIRDLAGAEIDNIKKYQARGQGRLVGSVDDVKELKRARKEGKLSEAMLERRVKLKSDRYC